MDRSSVGGIPVLFRVCNTQKIRVLDRPFDEGEGCPGRQVRADLALDSPVGPDLLARQEQQVAQVLSDHASKRRGDGIWPALWGGRRGIRGIRDLGAPASQEILDQIDALLARDVGDVLNMTGELS